ncbi:hypothetical protein I3843_14G017700 [Carya illinoinensis]|nr:hypothetical protein I3843_14G017700 [Carya illinoinensis]
MYACMAAVVHPFAEHIVYFMLFTIPLLTTVFTGTASIASFAGYITFIDFMNNLGHCNFELIPKWLFSIFPPLKYLIYTPSFHSLHHTQFRTNYSLFMPLYDYVYGTMDKSTDTLYEASLKRPEESPDVVHLTHLTTPESIYHLRLGFASLASWPHSSKWYLRLLWPVTLFWSVIISGIYGHAFVLERITFKAVKLQSWLVPRYNIQYIVQWQREALNTLIEEAILDAEVKGVKVLSLGLLNQAITNPIFKYGEEMNRNGELYIKRYPQLKIRLVDGSSLAVAVVLNRIPKGTTQVLLRGKLSKVACAIADALCESGIQVAILYKDEYEKLRLRLTTESKSNLVISTSFTNQKFPPKKLRKDCSYQATPAMIAPTSLISNMHSCENWLPRRVMSAWRIAGILHALEGWNVHECGNTMFDINKVWQASLQHGFRPLTTPAAA